MLLSMAGPAMGQSVLWSQAPAPEASPREGAWDRPAPVSPRGIPPTGQTPDLAAEALGIVEPPPVAAPPPPPPTPAAPPIPEPPKTPGLPLVVDFSPNWMTAWVPYAGASMTPAEAPGGVAVGELRASLPMPDQAGLHAGVRARLPVEVARALAGQTVRVSLMVRPLPGALGVGLAVSLAGPQGDSGWFRFDPPTGPVVLTARIALPTDEIGAGLLSLGIWPDVGGTGGGVLVEAVKLELVEPSPATAPVATPHPLAASTPAKPALVKPALAKPALAKPPASKPPAKASAVEVGGSWGAHLASYSSRERAERGWRELVAAHPALMAYQPLYTPIDLPDGRRFIRLIAGGFTNEAAVKTLCTTAGLDYCKPLPVSGG